ncbi:MAG TPA: glycosyltransferase family 2 protein, partial [Chroococcales cyanobacterium]
MKKEKKDRKKTPSFSIVLPCRNEESFLARCLDSIYGQTVLPLEVILADGMSTDRTREIARVYAEKHGNLKVIDNPEKIAPTALNRAIEASSGGLIARVDAHCFLEPDYLEECLAAFERSGADNVGGPMRPLGEGKIASAISLATSSPFGVGNALFHYAKEDCFVDTVYLGCYRREVFERIGLFDPELVRNQDDEFNYRLTLAGGKIFCSAKI